MDITRHRDVYYLNDFPCGNIMFTLRDVLDRLMFQTFNLWMSVFYHLFRQFIPKGQLLVPIELFFTIP